MVSHKNYNLNANEGFKNIEKLDFFLGAAYGRIYLPKKLVGGGLTSILMNKLTNIVMDGGRVHPLAKTLHSLVNNL